MNLKSITTRVAILLVGVAIGWRLPRGAPAAIPANAGTADQHAPARTRAGERRDKPVLQGRNDVDANQVSTLPMSDDMENNRDMILVPSSLIGELSRAAGVRTTAQDLFSRDGLIEESLGITDREKADIQTAWRTSRRKIRDLEAASMKSEEIDEWSVRITVPDLTQSMSSPAKDFRTAVQRALGADRSEAFLAAKQVDGMFTPPAGERNYTVTSEEIGDGKWRYRMTLEDPEGSRVWVGENIPDEIRHLTDAARIQPSLDDS